MQAGAVGGNGISMPRSRYIIVIAVVMFVVALIRRSDYNLSKGQHVEDVASQEGVVRRGTAVVDEKGRSYYSVPVPSFPLGPDGLFSYPNVTTLWFDVGAHESAMYSRDSLNARPELGVIAFEPMYDKWGKLSTTNRVNDRLFTVPAAVSSGDPVSFSTFRRAATDMCSSLRPIDTRTRRKDWPPGCTETIWTVTVPTVTLASVLERIPSSIRLEMLKIDAQGSDFDVVKSAGDAIKRFDQVYAEVQVGVTLYAGSATKEMFTSYMEDKGFVLVSANPQNRAKTEINVFFVRKGSGIDPETVDIPDEPGRKQFTKPDRIIGKDKNGGKQQ